MTWVKICGTTNLEDAKLAVDAGADAIGFVFAPHSTRHVTAEQVAEIVRELPSTVEKVGVFAGQSWSDIRGTLHTSGVDTVQVYPNGDLGAPREFPELETGAVKPIVALAFEDVGGPSGVFAIPNGARLLFDSGSQRYGGGTGETWDWAAKHPLIDHFRQAFDVIVAGGLTPENVTTAIETLHPWGVDVASGVEREPGKKDPEKVRAFIAAVRQADEQSATQSE